MRKGGVVVLTICAGFIGGMAASRLQSIPVHAQADAPAQNIKAERIVLVDRKGQSRIMMFTGTEGEPNIIFLSKEGKPRGVWTIKNDKSVLNFYAADGKRQSAINDDMLVFKEGDDKPRIVMTLLDDGRAALRVYNKNLEPIWSAP